MSLPPQHSPSGNQCLNLFPALKHRKQSVDLPLSPFLHPPRPHLKIFPPSDPSDLRVLHPRCQQQPGVTPWQSESSPLLTKNRMRGFNELLASQKDQMNRRKQGGGNSILSKTSLSPSSSRLASCSRLDSNSLLTDPHEPKAESQLFIEKSTIPRGCALCFAFSGRLFTRLLV